jgi:hypothetical protein
MGVLSQRFRPELLNRIDEIIVFTALDKDQLTQITRLLLDHVGRRVHAHGIELEVTDGSRAPRRGGRRPAVRCRPLRRAIQRMVENRLSEASTPHVRVAKPARLACLLAAATPMSRSPFISGPPHGRDGAAPAEAEAPAAPAVLGRTPPQVRGRAAAGRAA